MNKIYTLFILVSFFSCSKKEITKTECVENYFEGFKQSDYHLIKGTLVDSLEIYAGDYKMEFTPESYYKQFQWDSVFKPVYKVLSVTNKNEAVLVTVSVATSKFEFLKNNPLTTNYKFSFKANKIYKIEDLGSVDVNWNSWGKQRDTLVNWIKVNHPNLDGFVSDLSKQGAINYLKAIELFKNNQVD